jgi:hypothetical protein
VNHLLIQLYRTGADYISEHSDKTIDIVRGLRIVNLSLGARRIMTLRTTKDIIAAGGEQGANGERAPDGDGGAAVQRTTQRIPLPHNSLFDMGLTTNSRWVHSVHMDKTHKRLENTKDPSERGPRISLTLRHIGTFLTTPSSPTGQEQEQQKQQLIFGQDATGKTRAGARPVVHGGEEAERLLGVGAENHQSEFDWEKAYGDGLDVLHFSTSTAASV